jgi:hypothetical protein
MIERMYEIKNMKYECVYSLEVVERIQELAESDYSVDDCLDFIDKYGEEEFFQYYDLLVDFEEDCKNVDTSILIDYYSGFSFLDQEYYGEYPCEQSFIEKYYEVEDFPSVVTIDWDKTINQVKQLFDFIPTGKQSLYVFGK